VYYDKFGFIVFHRNKYATFLKLEPESVFQASPLLYSPEYLPHRTTGILVPYWCCTSSALKVTSYWAFILHRSVEIMMYGPHSRLSNGYRGLFPQG